MTLDFTKKAPLLQHLQNAAQYKANEKKIGIHFRRHHLYFRRTLFYYLFLSLDTIPDISHPKFRTCLSTFPSFSLPPPLPWEMRAFCYCFLLLPHIDERKGGRKEKKEFLNYARGGRVPSFPSPRPLHL